MTRIQKGLLGAGIGIFVLVVAWLLNPFRPRDPPIIISGGSITIDTKHPHGWKRREPASPTDFYAPASGNFSVITTKHFDNNGKDQQLQGSWSVKVKATRAGSATTITVTPVAASFCGIQVPDICLEITSPTGFSAGTDTDHHPHKVCDSAMPNCSVSNTFIDNVQINGAPSLPSLLTCESQNRRSCRIEIGK